MWMEYGEVGVGGDWDGVFGVLCVFFADCMLLLCAKARFDRG